MASKLSAADKISKARSILIINHPFFGHAAMSAQIREDPTRAPTGYTDGKNIGYNPKWIDGLTLAQTIGFIAHEGMHIMLGHPARLGKREPMKANIAMDMVINPILTANNIQLPPTELPNDPKNAERSFEAIYAELPDIPQLKIKLRLGSGEGGKGDPGGCGGVVEVVNEKGEPASPAEVAEAIQAANVMLSQAIQLAKMAGRVPAGMERLIDQLLRPVVDWRDALRRFVDRCARDNYSWARPNRRYMSSGLVLPSLHSESLPPIAVAIDTSGSITPRELDQFGAELSSILAEYRASAVVLYVDAAVAGVQHVSTDDLPLVLKPRGGGGTDFKPPFHWLAKHSVSPACMVYFTDLECSSYPQAPEYPVIWCHIGSGGTEPPFGERIEMERGADGGF